MALGNVRGLSEAMAAGGATCEDGQNLPHRSPGILIIRFDNDPTRDMTPRHIVTAIARLESAGVPSENQVHILHH